MADIYKQKYFGGDKGTFLEYTASTANGGDIAPAVFTESPLCDFENSPAANITTQDINNWNNGGEIFKIITYYDNDLDTYVIDKTFNEILAAYNNGKVIQLGQDDGDEYTIYDLNCAYIDNEYPENSYFTFMRVNNASNTVGVDIYSDNSIYYFDSSVLMPTTYGIHAMLLYGSNNRYGIYSNISLATINNLTPVIFPIYIKGLYTTGTYSTDLAKTSEYNAYTQNFGTIRFCNALASQGPLRDNIVSNTQSSWTTFQATDNAFEVGHYYVAEWDPSTSILTIYNDKFLEKEASSNVKDWNQNDSTADDYIQNRTHYAEEDNEFIWANNLSIYPRSVVNESNYVWFSLTNYYSIPENSEDLMDTDLFIPGKTYSITLDNVEYNNLIAYEFEDSSKTTQDKYYAIGNSNILLSAWSDSTITDGLTHDTSLPFVILYNYFRENEYTNINFYGDKNSIPANTVHTISIEGYAKKVGLKLNSGFLNGKLIKKGSGLDAEIFNTSFNVASGGGSHAEGYETTAIGEFSHAEGVWTCAMGDSSHAEGISDGSILSCTFNLTGDGNATTYTVNSHTLSSDYSPFHILLGFRYYGGGIQIIDYSVNNQVLTSITLSETLSETAINNKAYTFTLAGSTAIGAESHVEGYSTVAADYADHAEGGRTIALGGRSHAEGDGTLASGHASHAEGNITKALGEASHAEGACTIAFGENQHVQGKYNIEDTNNTYADIVGNGTSSTRSNAYTLDWNGNGIYAGKLTVGAGPTNNMDVATKQYVDNNAGVQSDWEENDNTEMSYVQNRTHYEYIDDEFVWCEDKEIVFTNALDSKTFSPDTGELYKNITKAEHFIENETYTITLNNIEYNLTCYTGNVTSTGKTVFYLGNSSLVPSTHDTITSNHNTDLPFLVFMILGGQSIYFNRDTNVILNNVTQTLSIIGPGKAYNNLSFKYLDGKLIQYGIGNNAEIFNSTDNIASGYYSHAEGKSTIASGPYSHTESLYNTASGTYSHAEGYQTTAKTQAAHSEGYQTVVDGSNGHAEGFRTIAKNQGSHAEGIVTKAGQNSSDIQGSHAEGYATFASGAGAHVEGAYGSWNNKKVTKQEGSLVCTLNDPTACSCPIDGQVTVNNVWVYLSFYSTNANSLFPVSNLTITNGYLIDFTLDLSQHSFTENYISNITNAATTNGNVSIFVGSMANGNGAHAEGRYTFALADNAHAEGWHTAANSNSSHAEGNNTIASSENQHVQGKYNIIDSNDTYLDIVGNGTAHDARSNAYTLDWSGNGVYAGKVTVGAAPTANMDVATKLYVDTAVSGLSPTISGLSDTTITNAADGDMLLYDSTSSKWVNTSFETAVNALITAALAEYGDGDIATYGYTDGNEVNY